jgi:NAD(P)-dependent dehydrogenase (short-subunit alcohol dehydrogenase family)
MKEPFELMNLAGRVAIVTGGAGHLGRVFGSTLASLGAAVVLVDCKASVGAEAEGLPGRGQLNHWGIAADLADESALSRLAQQIYERYGRIDILVNNAGFISAAELKGWAVPFQQQSSEAWHAAMHLNLTVPFILTQACAPYLCDSGHGAVINIASIYGLVGPQLSLYEGTSMGNPAAYNASKGGLLQLTRYLATNLAPKVRVNAISPGGVERGQPHEFVQRYCSRTPLARMAREEDFIGAMAYLASDASRYVTGHDLVVDGGWTIW